MSSPRKATESLSFQESLSRLSKKRRFARNLIPRLQRIGHLDADSTIVELGSAQGQFCIALQEMGLAPIGIEPWDQARRQSQKLAEHENRTLDIREGRAEDIPLDDGSCDAVVAANVIEHVLDAEKTFSEVFRVLKPGGVFWFSAASSVCPRQKEIDGFPLFGWYPNALKLKIMDWAKRRKPHLVGHTETPAINWFTRRKAARMLQEAGFVSVYDRWDLRLAREGARGYRVALGLIRSCGLTRLLADVLCEGCAYAAVKAIKAPVATPSSAPTLEIAEIGASSDSRRSRKQAQTT